MDTKTKDRLSKLVGEVVRLGHGVCSFQGSEPVYFREMGRFRASSQNLIRMLGSKGEMWKVVFEKPGYLKLDAMAMLGTVEAIQQAIVGELLGDVESMVFAEAFSDLLEQAEYLLGETHFVPAGVLARAVLEERLRKWCDRENCTPIKNKGHAMLNDFNMALYKAKHIDAIKMKHIEWIASVGNKCAHEPQNVRKPDVDKMVPAVRDFLQQNPL